MTGKHSPDGNLYTTGTLGNSQENERDRLRALEAVADPVTIGIMRRIGLATDARCLEIGAGGGSMASWLARHCRDGHVVAADIDTVHLRDIAGLEVVTHDVASDDFPGESFDLVHARVVLCHLRDPDTVLAKITRWVAPGGSIVIEDPVFAPLGPSTHPVFRRLVAGIGGLLPAPVDWAPTLPTRLARAGFTDIGCLPRCVVVGNGGPADDLWRRTVLMGAPVLVQRGALTQQEIAGVIDLPEDRTFVDIPFAFMSAWGRREPS